MTRNISQQQNEILMVQVDASEVKKTFFSMHHDKSPGPDGMSPGFYKKIWKIVRDDMVELDRNFFVHDTLEENIGDTNIVLIPKKKNPINMIKFLSYFFV